jgi:hypothetical protein
VVQRRYSCIPSRVQYTLLPTSCLEMQQAARTRSLLHLWTAAYISTKLGTWSTRSSAEQRESRPPAWACCDVLVESINTKLARCRPRTVSRSAVTGVSRIRVATLSKVSCRLECIPYERAQPVYASSCLSLGARFLFVDSKLRLLVFARYAQAGVIGLKRCSTSCSRFALVYHESVGMPLLLLF